MNRLYPYFEALAHVTLIVSAVALVSAYLLPKKTNDPFESASATRDSLTVHVDSSPILSEWHAPEHRVLLFMSPTCPFSDHSMEFYARLGNAVDSLQRNSFTIATAAVISESASRRLQEQVLQASGVSVDTLLQLSSSLSAVGVSGVPTVTILDSSGQTRAAWVGLQGNVGEYDILSMVRATETAR